MGGSKTANSPLRIACVEAGSGRGGSAWSLLRLAKAISVNHSEDMALLIVGCGAYGASLFQQHGIPAMALHSRSFCRRFMEIRRLLRQQRCHILHCNNHPYDHFPHILAAWSLGVRVTVHLRASRDLTRSERVVLRRVEHCFAVSSSAAKVLSEQAAPPAERVSDLGDGTDLALIAAAGRKRETIREAMGVEGGQHVVLLAATLQPGKGQDRVIEAEVRLGGEDRDRVWWFAGGEHYQSPGYARILAEKIEAARLGDRIRLLGHRADMPDILAASDLVALPSELTEGTPCILMEAMAAGRPIIAASTGGIPDMVDDQIGALIPPGDTQALATAVVALLSDSSRRQACGRAAEQRARDRYDIRSIADTFVETMQSLG